MHSLILASQSPRRKKIFMDAGYKISVHPVKVSEIIDENLNVAEALLAVSEQKLKAAQKDLKSLKSLKKVLITADTGVVIGQQILGKPVDEGQAMKFLKLLSGQKHQVMTAFCVHFLDECVTYSQVCESLVEFKVLSDEKIQSYISTGEPMDKAGAYGIQGQGKELVKAYQGSWSNIVGFPIEEFERMAQMYLWEFER